MAMSNQTQAEVIIVGGGITALTLAGLLVKFTPLTVAILEQQEIPTQWPEGSVDGRVSAISPGVKKLFDALACWSEIKREGIAPYSTLYVWEKNHPEGIHFASKDCGEPYLGYIIENRVMRKVLFETLQASNQIAWLCPKKAKGFDIQSDGVTLTCDDGSIITGNLLVGADGSHSWCRQQRNIPVSEKPYHHHALVTTVRTEKSHQQTPTQVFLPSGPLAFLPLQDQNLSSIVWSTSPEHCERLKNLDEQDFLVELTEAFDKRFGRVTQCLTPRLSFPLIFRRAEHLVHPRFALVGDAAHTIHPLAGQGLNLGMLDSASLAEVIIQALESQQDYSHLHTLRKYERWRKSENALMMHTINLLKQLYEQTNPMIKLLRTVGLTLCQKNPPLKNAFMRQAMNLAGQQPTVLFSKAKNHIENQESYND